MRLGETFPITAARKRKAYRYGLFGLAILIILLLGIALLIGRGFTLLWPLPLQEAEENIRAVELIFWEIRLPRAALVFMTGIGLGLSGAVLQGYLRNPLAEPGVLGVSASAALGAVLAFQTGFAARFDLGLPLAGIAGAAMGSALLMLLTRGRHSLLAIILAGVALNSLAAALTSLIITLAPSVLAAVEIVFWLMGSFADRSLEQVWLAAPFMVLGWGVLAATAPALDALSLGEEAAISLGVAASRLRWQIIAGTALAVGASVAVVGAIGFVGLMVPHLLRPLAAHRPSQLLPLAALGGAALLLAADNAVRLLSPGTELQIGIVTALMGAPFFLMLLWRLGRSSPYNPALESRP